MKEKEIKLEIEDNKVIEHDMLERYVMYGTEASKLTAKPKNNTKKGDIE